MRHGFWTGSGRRRYGRQALRVTLLALLSVLMLPVSAAALDIAVVVQAEAVLVVEAEAVVFVNLKHLIKVIQFLLEMDQHLLQLQHKFIQLQ